MFSISQEIKDKALVFCSKQGGCINDTNVCSCIPREFMGSFLVVEPKHKPIEVPCHNCIKMEKHYVCLCAIRKEIFRKYNQ